MDIETMKRAFPIGCSIVLIGSFSVLLNMFFPMDTFGTEPIIKPQSNLDQNVKNPTLSEDVYYKTKGIVSGPPAPRLTKEDYPKLNLPPPFGESRLIIWILAQQHRYFAGLCLGVLFWIMVLELGGLWARGQETSQRYDGLAYESLGLIILAYSMTAILGVIFLFGLLALYPDFTKYLVGVFRPFFMVYGLLFLVLSVVLYIYYYTWKPMYTGFSKWVHASLSILANILGISIMLIANSWSTFMMSPAGVDAQGRFLGNYWNVLHNALWHPFNFHRFFGNLIFGAAVMAAYAAFQALKAKTQEERTYYDWMGYLAFVGVVIALFTFPFGGYWLQREIYGYRQQMGITLLGGLLAWLGIVLVFLIGALFFGINYYIWQRIDSIEGGHQYRHHAKYVFFILTVCIFVFATPHTLVMKASELKAIGGQQHPIIGNFGVESAKQPAINIMMLVTIWSLLMWWRSQFQMSKSTPSKGDAMLLGLFLAGAFNLIWLGIYGFYIPANVRVGLSVPMVLTTLSILVLGSVLTYTRISQAKRITSPLWGNLSVRGHYTLLFIAVTITWIMGLGGYQRSSVRLFWHAMEIFRDSSPWAFTHTIGFAGNVISMNTLLFWSFLLLIVWLKKVGHYQIEKEKLISRDKPARP